ncbi:hypothetical protein MPTK1_5g15540 [Marchantia polymorpha subsp. ruderalis]|uniref:Uncharacterized protein n=2 Tax=Marchantia polymorpha TaxID=3197 RepID=A0AAF6BIP7_MARPO|nr:hypothetical protein MARPO_0071s0055 [Marchantia polymorpha]BBN11881.1 hypothetical protein Mp_5g15540 [Marchantia polymorpha subsp. ruderalis]|eukprot:PTQ35439.1 hypothetical protein MARPO_0071s0055 [Marchantia polymorpha]
MYVSSPQRKFQIQIRFSFRSSELSPGSKELGGVRFAATLGAVEQPKQQQILVLLLQSLFCVMSLLTFSVTLLSSFDSDVYTSSHVHDSFADKIIHEYLSEYVRTLFFCEVESVKSPLSSVSNVRKLELSSLPSSCVCRARRSHISIRIVYPSANLWHLVARAPEQISSNVMLHIVNS